MAAGQMLELGGYHPGPGRRGCNRGAGFGIPRDLSKGVFAEFVLWFFMVDLVMTAVAGGPGTAASDKTQALPAPSDKNKKINEPGRAQFSNFRAVDFATGQGPSGLLCRPKGRTVSLFLGSGTGP